MSRSSETRLLPHDREAEQAVLGSIIHDNANAHPAAELLTPDAFFSPAHRDIFSVMLGLAEDKSRIDEISISDALRNQNRLENAGGLVYIAELVDLTPVASNVRYYAHIVRQKALLRSLIASSMDIAAKGREGMEDPDALIGKAEEIFTQLAQEARSPAMGELIHSARTVLERLYAVFESGRGAVEYIPVGIPEFDKKLDGFPVGFPTVIAARTGEGKTLLANQAFLMGGLRKVSTLFVTLELREMELMGRGLRI